MGGLQGRRAGCSGCEPARCPAATRELRAYGRRDARRRRARASATGRGAAPARSCSSRRSPTVSGRWWRRSTSSRSRCCPIAIRSQYGFLPLPPAAVRKALVARRRRLRAPRRAAAAAGQHSPGAGGARGPPDPDRPRPIASASVTRVAVVGHVEWVDFVRVDQYPVRGEVQRAQRESTRAGGGGVVAAAVLAGLGAEVDFYCALGHDANGEAAAGELRERGIPSTSRGVRGRRAGDDAAGPGWRAHDHHDRRAARAGGRRRAGLGRLTQADGVYVTAGDQGALRARAAPRACWWPRPGCGRGSSGRLYIDALVFSASDEDEVRWAQRLEPEARLMVATEGPAAGGGASPRAVGRGAAPGRRDGYGCGDSFAAGTFGLARPVARRGRARWGAARCCAGWRARGHAAERRVAVVEHQRVAVGCGAMCTPCRVSPGTTRLESGARRRA